MGASASMAKGGCATFRKTPEGQIRKSITAHKNVTATRGAAAFWAEPVPNTPAKYWSDTNNPNGEWRFGKKNTQLGDFVLYDKYLSSIGARRWWITNNSFLHDYTPTVWKNVSEEPREGVLPGNISLHPGADGEWSVVRWTAPSTQNVHFIGSFGEGDTGAVSYVVLHNEDTYLFNKTSSMATEGFDISIDVEIGDTVDFQVGGVYFSGNTPLTINATGTGGETTLANGRINI